jgi:hypothetical protein
MVHNVILCIQLYSDHFHGGKMAGIDEADAKTPLSPFRQGFGKVSASTQNQAFNVLLFLFRNVLKIEIGDLSSTIRAKRGPKLPVVFDRRGSTAAILLYGRKAAFCADNLRITGFPGQRSASGFRMNLIPFIGAGQILEAGVFFLEGQLDDARRSVSLLADDDLCYPLFRVVFRPVVHLVPVDEGDHVRVLFDRPGFTEIRHLRPAVGSVLHLPVQLRQGDHR